MLRLDKRPSHRTLVILIVSGAVLLILSSVAGGLLSLADQTGPVRAPALTAPEIRASLQQNTHGTLPALLNGFRAAGYGLFVFGACVYLARRAAPNRLLSRTSCAFALLGPAAALCNLGAAALIIITLTADGAVPDGLILAIPPLAGTELVVWTAFVWMAALGLYLWIKKRRRTSPPAHKE